MGGRIGSTVHRIKQDIVLASSGPDSKLELLLEVLPRTEGRTLIFVRRKQTASQLTLTLRENYNIPVEEIHGAKSQNQRESALRNFRSGKTRVLVATDVASRGLDVPAITHVI